MTQQAAVYVGNNGRETIKDVLSRVRADPSYESYVYQKKVHQTRS